MKFRVTGMGCSACVKRVEKAASKVEGVTEVSVNLLTETMEVFFSAPATVEEITEAVKKAGYGISEIEEVILPPEKQKGKVNVIVSLILAASLFTLNLVLKKPDFWISLLLFLPIAGMNYRIYYRGFLHLVKLSPDMDSLVLLSLIASLIMLNFDTAGMVTAFTVCGRFMERKALLRTRDELLLLTQNALPEQVNAPAGTRYNAQRNHKIYVDSVIVKGTGYFDTSMITGEFMPALKRPGDEVPAGSTCLSGDFEMKSVRDYESSAMAQIMKLCSDTASGKTEIGRLADKLAGYFVPAVMLLAIVFSLVRYFFMSERDIEAALFVLAGVLVVSCPCAMGLATPAAIMKATGVAGSLKAMPKNAQVFEKLAGCDTFIFDKTGTLTKGKLKVKDVELLTKLSEEECRECLSAACSMEAVSTHPIASAIIAYTYGQNIVMDEISDFEEEVGVGVRADMNGNHYEIVRSDGVTDTDIHCDLIKNSVRVMRFSFSDTLYENAREAISYFDTVGQVLILSGDAEEATKAVATALSVTNWKASLLPPEKEETVRLLKAEGHKVLMTGDGMNDAPALKSADVSVVFQNASGLAMQQADVIITGDIISLARLHKLSVRTLKIIKQNLFWALIYNCIFIPIAGFWAINPAICAICMFLSSMFVILNARRIGRDER